MSGEQKIILKLKTFPIGQTKATCLTEWIQSLSSGFRDFELTNAADSADLPYCQLDTPEINHYGINSRITRCEFGLLRLACYKAWLRIRLLKRLNFEPH